MPHRNFLPCSSRRKCRRPRIWTLFQHLTPAGQDRLSAQLLRLRWRRGTLRRGSRSEVRHAAA